MAVRDKIKDFKNSPVLQNSVWGLASSILQNVLLSLFFIFVARKYAVGEFAQFLIATTLYQVVAAFSTLGLGQWFIREYMATEEKEIFVSKFLKIQVYSGLFFYLINIALVYLIYPGALVRELAIILGINVIFDNVIFAIKNLNTAEFQQKKSFTILLIDAVVRFLVGISLFIFPIDISLLAILMIISRFATLNLFIKIGVQKTVGLLAVWKASVTYHDIKALLAANWSFIVIGVVSVIYWRIGSIVISKVLTDVDLANYEVSFKLLVLAQLVPLILSASVFPSLVKLFEAPGKEGFIAFYKRFFMIYFVFGLGAYTFIYSFAGYIMPMAFGARYAESAVYTQQMFLTMLVFPTVFLQGNVLIAMKMEKADMFINLVCMLVYVISGAIALYYVRSLASINYAIFGSFVLIHVLQDRVLIKHGMAELRDSIAFYLIIGATVTAYIFLSQHINPFLLFFSFWGIAMLIMVISMFKQHKILLWRNQS